MYQWFVFLHLLGVFAFLVAHGVSVGVSFRLRGERDPTRVAALLDVSSRSIGPMWISIGVLLVGGIVAGFLGDWWGYGWMWGSIGTLVVVIALMSTLATRYYARVRTITTAVVDGSEAVSPEEFDGVLRSGRPLVIAVIGFVGLGAILWMMMFKPTFGLSPAPSDTPDSAAAVDISADATSFDTDLLEVPADDGFTIRFENTSQVPHNVAIYTDESATEDLFVGRIVTGPASVDYGVDPLAAGTYFFRCDLHPTTMTGTVEAG